MNLRISGQRDQALCGQASEEAHLWEKAKRRDWLPGNAIIVSVLIRPANTRDKAQQSPSPLKRNQPTVNPGGALAVREVEAQRAEALERQQKRHALAVTYRKYND